MAAGPWFTVRTQEDGWQVLDRIWISNGQTDELGVIEYRSRLLPAAPASAQLAVNGAPKDEP